MKFRVLLLAALLLPLASGYQTTEAAVFAGDTTHLAVHPNGQQALVAREDAAGLETTWAIVSSSIAILQTGTFDRVDCPPVLDNCVYDPVDVIATPAGYVLIGYGAQSTRTTVQLVNSQVGSLAAASYLGFHADEISVSDDGTSILLRDGQNIRWIERNGTGFDTIVADSITNLRSALISGDGQRIAYFTNDEFVMNREGETISHSLTAQESRVMTWDDSYLVVGYADGSIAYFRPDTQSMNLVRKFTPDLDAPLALAEEPEGILLLTSGGDLYLLPDGVDGRLVNASPVIDRITVATSTGIEVSGTIAILEGSRQAIQIFQEELIAVPAPSANHLLGSAANTDLMWYVDTDDKTVGFATPEAKGVLTLHDDSIAPGQSKNFTFQFKNTGDRATEATPRVELPRGWAISYDPGLLTFEPGQTQTVTIGLRASGTAPAGLQEVDLNMGPASGTFTILVDAVQELGLEAIDAYTQNVDAGSSLTLAAKATLQGNLAKEVTFQVAGPTGWTIAVNPTTTTIDPNSEAPVELTVQVPPNTPTLQSFLVRLSLAGEDVDYVEWSLTPGANPSATLEAAGPEQIVTAGESVRMERTVTNTGNVALQVGPVGAILPAGWTLVSSSPVTTVNPGASADLVWVLQPDFDAEGRYAVRVQVPLNAAGVEDLSTTLRLTVEAPAETQSSSSSSQTAPAAPIALVLAGLAVALLARRR